MVTQEQVANGELCYLLNQYNDSDTPIWYQTLGVDDHPVLDSTHGEVKLADDGTYYNEFDIDGIKMVDAARNSMAGVFNLAGQRVMNRKLPRGIYIINGKKIVTTQ